MISKLPLELQMHIIDLAIPPLRYDSFPDVHTAARILALVCRAWARPAQRRLFEAQMITVEAFWHLGPMSTEVAREIGELREGLELAEAHGCKTVALRITSVRITFEDPILAQDSSAVEMLGRRASMVDRVYVFAKDPPDALLEWLPNALPACRMLDFVPHDRLWDYWVASTPLPSNIERLQVHDMSLRLPFPSPALTHVLLVDPDLVIEPAHYPSLRVLAITDFSVSSSFVNSPQYFSPTLKHLGLFHPHWHYVDREGNVQHPLCLVLDKVHLSNLATLTIRIVAGDPGVAIIERRIEAARTAGVVVTVLAPIDDDDDRQADLEGWAAGL